MNTIEAIMTRRSVRQYQPGPLPDGALEILLRAAMSAPSAGNEQAWAFIVVDDRAVLKKLARFHPNAAMSAEAAAAILVCGDLERQKYPGYWIQDCAAAVQNILLAAHELGIGAVWSGVAPAEGPIRAFRRAFGLPDSIVPMAYIPLGLPAEHPAPESRFDPARVHRNRW